MSIKIIGDHEQQTIDQLERCVNAVEGARGVLCADGHLGYSQPIGGVVAYPDHVSPTGVGYDIGCGNLAVQTNLALGDVAPDLNRIMDEVVSQISFGMGRNNDTPVDDEVLDRIAHAEWAEQRSLVQLASNQLGTVGAGNHYVDLFADENLIVWIGVHFGSRGFGHKTASGFINLANGKDWFDKHSGESMHASPSLLNAASGVGEAYVEAMTLAGDYAHAGRIAVVRTVLGILGAEAARVVHNHHNFAWRERHSGTDYWVVRKGATPAWPGQTGFVGSTMADNSVILQGNIEVTREAEDSLFSTVHGAGRTMSRTEAAGKVKKRKRWGCSLRECDYIMPPDRTTGPEPVCPEHGGRLKKFWLNEQVKVGKVNWPAWQQQLAARGIVLRGGAADEAPPAYKVLSDVLTEHTTVAVTDTLRPIGVAMAGADTFDPFRD